MTTISHEWADAIDSWATSLRAAGRAESSIRTRTDHLHWLASWASPRSPWALSLTDLNEWTGSKTWARETRRSVRASMRSFFAWAVQSGHLEASPAIDLASIKPGAPRPHPTPDAEYRAALERAPERERLMLRLAAEYGMRRAEVAQVHTDDVSFGSRGYTLLVHGKGDRERELPLRHDDAGKILDLGPGFIFPGEDAGHLSPRWVGTIIARRLPGQWTMHSLRHRFATRAYALNRDTFVVQELLGHASPATTRLYVLLPDDAKRDVINRLGDAA